MNQLKNELLELVDEDNNDIWYISYNNIISRCKKKKKFTACNNAL